MVSPIQLNALALTAFEDLQRHEEEGQLSAYAERALPHPPMTADATPLVIKANLATAERWLATAIIRSLALSSHSCLVVTGNRRAHLLGHAMLATSISPKCFNQEHLTVNDWMLLTDACRPLVRNELSVLVREKHQKRISFIRLVRHHIRDLKIKVLVIDQPAQCFRRQPKGNKAWSEGIPPSLRAMASIWGFQIIVLCSDPQELTQTAHAP